MLTNKLRRLTAQGDTIVEVMVVLTILGLALSISYATANRSLLDTRQAEENAQATRYVQAQVEALYNLASTGTKPGQTGYPGSDSPTDIYSWTNTFCYVNGSNLLASTDPNCSNYANANLYQLDVYYCDRDPHSSTDICATDTPNTTDTFIIRATWLDVAGDGTDSVTEAYRIHPNEGN